MLFCCFLCVRVRASSRAICLKAQLSRLAGQRRPRRARVATPEALLQDLEDTGGGEDEGCGGEDEQEQENEPEQDKDEGGGDDSGKDDKEEEEQQQQDEGGGDDHDHDNDNDNDKRVTCNKKKTARASEPMSSDCAAELSNAKQNKQLDDL